MISTPAAVTGRGLAKAAAKRFAIAILASVLATIVLMLAGVPAPIPGAIGQGVMFTVFFTGAFPEGTANRVQKNTLLWGAHFVMFTSGFLLIRHLRGA